VSTKFRRLYGGHPLHLLTLMASFALVGYVISVLGTRQLWNGRVWWQSILVWFVAAILLHDVVLFPLYALADRSLGAGWRAVTGRLPDRTPPVSAINYVRIPVMASGLLFLMFFPGIIEQGKVAYHNATGLTQAPFLDRWLLITAVLFGSSALAYGIRILLVRRHPEGATPSSGTARALSDISFAEGAGSSGADDGAEHP
jgi:hypothetical protein